MQTQRIRDEKENRDKHKQREGEKKCLRYLIFEDWGKKKAKGHAKGKAGPRRTWKIPMPSNQQQKEIRLE